MSEVPTESRRRGEYLRRLAERADTLRHRLETAALRHTEEIAKELHALEWAIERLSTFSEKAKPEWVRCGEAKPNVYDSILLTDGVERITGFLCPSGEWARHDGGEWNPTHWMQLPACPERPRGGNG